MFDRKGIAVTEPALFQHCPEFIENSTPMTNRKNEMQEGPMAARYFRSIEAMADYQVDRELQEALRVQSMSPQERFQWLTQTWGRLQDGASSLFADFPQQAGMARCYASFEEKNRFDEERELKFALQRQMAA